MVGSTSRTPIKVSTNFRDPPCAIPPERDETTGGEMIRSGVVDGTLSEDASEFDFGIFGSSHDRTCHEGGVPHTRTCSTDREYSRVVAQCLLIAGCGRRR